MEDEKLNQIELYDVNPLLQSTEITLGEEVEQAVSIINEIESIAELNKQQLSIQRERISLEVDKKKLDTAKKTAGTLEKIIESIASEEVIERVKGNIKTPMDMKMMAEAADRLSSTLKNLMNPSVADEMGSKKRQKINFAFKGSGQVAVQIDNGGDDR